MTCQYFPLFSSYTEQWTYFKYFSSVSINDFEQVNAYWVVIKWINNKMQVTSIVSRAAKNTKWYYIDTGGYIYRH